MEIARNLNLLDLLQKKSFFLFGPRATGKSTLIRQQLQTGVTVIDLLDSRVYLKLLDSPHELEAIISADRDKIVVIDEIQRIPELLNEVHRLIENRKLTFLLTGSSARKLRRGYANLLAGRVWEARLFPFIYLEIADDFNLDRFLRYGGLPAVYLSDYPEEELNAYVNTYLKEEIMAEGLIRKLPPFSRFLKTMALSNTEIINFTKLANDCQVPPSTVTEYVALLEDTLVGFLIQPWKESKKRKAISTAKFYFFDPGITHMLSGTRVLDRNSNIFGKSFEQFIAMEIRAYLSYRRKRDELRFWRSRHGHEVDFLIGLETAVEVKASQKITDRDFKGLKILAEENVFKNYIVVSQDELNTRKNNFQALHWRKFLHELWHDSFTENT